MQDNGTKQITNHSYTFIVYLTVCNSVKHVEPYVRIEVNNLCKEMWKKAVLNTFTVLPMAVCNNWAILRKASIMTGWFLPVVWIPIIQTLKERSATMPLHHMLSRTTQFVRWRYLQRCIHGQKTESSSCLSLSLCCLSSNIRINKCLKSTFMP
jgi:hypothetical protein